MLLTTVLQLVLLRPWEVNLPPPAVAANSGVASLADRRREMQMCRHLWVRASGGVVGVGECANPATAN